MMAARQAVWGSAVVGMVVLVGLAGCSINVNKDNAGKDKDVSIHTPFGGVQVHKDKSGKAIDTGMPVYPGAVLQADDRNDDDKSVDVQLGFGPWQMRVQVASYSTADPQEKVQAFYKKALGRYGDVLTCRGNSPVGQPTRTNEGLTCSDQGESRNVHVTKDANLELKAGSDRKQHIVAFDDKHEPNTHFALVALSLPQKDHEDRNSDSSE